LYGVAYTLVPGFETSRHPATAVVVWHLCLVLLACFGFDRLPRVRAVFVAKTAGTLALFSLFVYGTVIYLSLANPAKVFGRNEQSMAALTALALSGLLFGFLRGAVPLPYARAGCLAIAMIEVSNVAGYTYMHRSTGWEHLRPLFEDDDLADFLRKEPGFVRVNFDRSEIAYNFGDWWGVDDYQGYTGVSEAMFRRAFEAETRKLLGETHWLSKSANWNGRTPVFQSRRGISVYRLEVSAQRVSCGRVTEAYPGYWRIDARGCESLFVNEAWGPGWLATVDGKAAAVEKHEGLLKAVALKVPAQVVELRYAPGSAKWGATLTAIGFLAVAGLGVSRKKLLHRNNTQAIRA
jgi:hypothetical protein